jgi:hypothetical protein
VSIGACIQSDRLVLMHNAAYARFENNPARQLAYQMFADDPSRAITEWLPALRQEIGENVAARTVQEWRHRDRWEQRYAEERAAESGVLVVEHVRRVRVAVPHLVSYLDRIARGEEAYDRGRVEVARFLIGEAGRFLSVLPQVQLPVPEVAVSSDISNAELLALVTKGRDAGGGGEEG